MSDLDRYIQLLRDGGATSVLVIDAAAIHPQAWVAMKCRYGCPRYGKSRSCPPYAPDWREMQSIVSCYRRAILFGVSEMSAGTALALTVCRVMGNDGYYKAQAFGTGPCTLCHDCRLTDCPHPDKAIPSPEACGIDVIELARSHGLTINIPPRPGKALNCYALILVD